MHVDISAGSAQFLQDQVASGSFQSPDAAVEAAIGLLRRHAEIRAKIQRGCDQLDRGEYIEFDDEGLTEFFAGLFGPEAVGDAAQRPDA